MSTRDALERALASLAASRREILRQLDGAAALAREAVRAHERGDTAAAREAIERACELEFEGTGREACDALGPLADIIAPDLSGAPTEKPAKYLAN